MGTAFVPNRIVRGRIVQYLREVESAPMQSIGRAVALDWDARKHHQLMQDILSTLQRDALITEHNGQYILTS